MYESLSDEELVASSGYGAIVEAMRRLRLALLEIDKSLGILCENTERIGNALWEKEKKA